MEYAVHNVPSYQHMMGKEQPAHMGSQSHTGSEGAPGHGSNEHDPGGFTESKVGASKHAAIHDSRPHV